MIYKNLIDAANAAEVLNAANDGWHYIAVLNMDTGTATVAVYDEDLVHIGNI